MLRHSYTAVVERARPLTGEFAIEPYEAGWATEALVFFKVRSEVPDSTRITSRIQISPDGIDWVDEGTSFETITAPGLYFVRVAHFGNWLRVIGRVSDDTEVRASVYVTLK